MNTDVKLNSGTFKRATAIAAEVGVSVEVLLSFLLEGLINLPDFLADRV